MGPLADVEGLLRAARRTGAFRVAIGAAALLAPGLAARALLREPDQDGARVLLRMFAGREIALGLGQVLATRRGPGAARGWLEAGALSDGTDVLALAANGSAVRPLTRWGGMLSALGATAASVVVARSLGAATGHATAGDDAGGDAAHDGRDR